VNGNVKLGGVRRLAVANGPNIIQMLLVYLKLNKYIQRHREADLLKHAAMLFVPDDNSLVPLFSAR